MNIQTRSFFNTAKPRISSGLCLEHVGCATCAPSFRCGPSIRNMHIIHYVISGKGYYEVSGHQYEVAAGGGVVNVKINGKKEILSVKIAPEVVDPDDIETLEDLIVAGVNEAIKKVETISSEEMQKITGNMSIPGMF